MSIVGTRREKPWIGRGRDILLTSSFANIVEGPFKALYSGKDSRPDTPVDVCIGALIIRELQGVSDEEMADSLMLDPRCQMALHTGSRDEQPLSGKTLQLSGTCLICPGGRKQDCLQDLRQTQKNVRIRDRQQQKEQKPQCAFRDQRVPQQPHY